MLDGGGLLHASKAKEKLVSAPVLAHYDPSQQLKLAAGASAYGIGAVISHMHNEVNCVCLQDTV